jgi:hypothetical protein
VNVPIKPSTDELYLADLLLQMGQGSSPSRELIDYVLGNPKKINDTAEVLSHPAQTLLHRATFLGQKLVAEWLVMKGADINAIDGDGKTPLDYAVAVQQMELANYLRSKDAFSAEDRFVDNQDGTATDTRTGLTWMRCALGQEWDGKQCASVAKGFTWGQAMALKHIFAGHTDWRMPNINELNGILDSTRTNPSIDISIFPGTPSAYFWSSLIESSSNLAWGTNFKDGNTIYGSTGFNNHVRLVRGGNTLISPTPPTSSGVPSKSISDSNGNSIYEAKTQVTPEAILTSPQFQVPKFAYEQGAEPMVSVTTKHRDMDTPTQPSTQQVKANEVDAHPPFETVLERLNLLEARFDKFINRIEGTLAPLSEDQSKTLDVINQLHLRSSASSEKLCDELTQLRQSIDCNESRFDASFNRIETDLKSLFQGQVKMMEAITLLHEHSTSHTNTFSNEFAVLRQVLVVALQSANAPTQVTDQFTANPEPDVIAVGDIHMFLEWLVGQDVIPLTELRIRLLPLDLLTSAVINDINERALDLTGEHALEEDGDNVIVWREVLLQVIAAYEPNGAKLI